MECHWGSCNRPELVAPIISQSNPIFCCRSDSARPSQRIKTKKSFLSLSRSPRGVVTGVGTADWGDPELVLMRRPLVDMQLCLLLCYLGASHRDPGGVIMPAGQKGQRPNPSTAPLDHLHVRTCTLAFICTNTKVPRFLNNFAPHQDGIGV